MPLIFFCVSSSTFLCASLNAAIIRSCSISTSPATSGSILTLVTFFWPSMPTVTMPPPAEASTRISATSSCIFCCIFWACCIMACMFPGIFMRRSPSRLLTFLQIANGAHLAFREQFLKALHFRMRQGTLRRFIFRRLGRSPGHGGCFSHAQRELDGPARHAPYRRFELLPFQEQLIHFGSRENDLGRAL